MQAEAGLGFNISGGESAGEVRGILVDYMGSGDTCALKCSPPP